MDIHIGKKGRDNKIVNCIFHVAVPDTNNTVGTNWRTVVQRALSPVPLMSWNDAAENTDIENGAVLEVSEQVRFSSVELTNTQRLAEVEAAYTARSTALLQELQGKLDFFGKEV